MYTHTYVVLKQETRKALFLGFLSTVKENVAEMMMQEVLCKATMFSCTGERAKRLPQSLRFRVLVSASIHVAVDSSSKEEIGYARPYLFTRIRTCPSSK